MGDPCKLLFIWTFHQFWFCRFSRDAGYDGGAMRRSRSSRSRSRSKPRVHTSSEEELRDSRCHTTGWASRRVKEGETHFPINLKFHHVKITISGAHLNP